MFSNPFSDKITSKVEKVAKMWSTSVILKKLDKLNIYPKGENSPNLVTLACAY
jgi:hypothetical protein